MPKFMQCVLFFHGIHSNRHANKSKLSSMVITDDNFLPYQFEHVEPAEVPSCVSSGAFIQVIDVVEEGTHPQPPTWYPE